MKRKAAAILSVFLLFTLLSPALAADADTVKISTADDLLQLAAHCTSDAWSEGKTIVLTRDINLTGCDFSPVPLLAGTFDGQGHSILGVSLDGDASTHGLFRMVLKTGAVRNLTVSGTLHASGNGENIGGIAGVNYGTIEHCRFDGDIRARKAAGGIVGLNAEGAMVTACTATGTIAAYHRSGGIAGENRGVLENCENRMSVNTEYIAVEESETRKSFDISSLTLQEEAIIDITDLGGIAGLNSSLIKYCDNAGDVGYPHTGYNVGGVAGRQSGRIIGSTNTGDITGRKDVGGIVGQIEPHKEWNVTGTGLADVQAQLYRLDSLMQTTLTDLGDSQAQASALMQEALRLLGDCSDIVGGMYPNITPPSPEDGSGNTEDSGEGGDQPSGWIEPDTGSKDRLTDNLQQIIGLLGQMTDVIASETVITDMRNVISQLMNVSASVMNMMYGLTNNAVQIEDVSGDTEDEKAVCLVAQCENAGRISADTNVGGIAGNVALDISFDREDQLSLSSALLGAGKYEIFARISHCENRSSVSASKSCAGGISGRMEYGMAVSCSAVGEVTAAEEYAGGIVGYSTASVSTCCARVNLSAQRYSGGIAGLGRDIAACRAMPHFASYCELRGSIAGYADGEIAENIYSDCTVGGVDGFSFTGQTDYMEHAAFANLSDTPEYFRSIDVTFVKDGEIVEKMDVPFGGRISAVPAIADRDGMYWQWNDFDGDAVYYSQTVEGEYIRPVTTISTGENEPLFLAEGVFREGQTLLAVSFTPDADALGLDAEAILAAYTVRVSDYADPIGVRMFTADTGSLYILSDGTLAPLPYTRDGSYIVFRLDNGASIVYIAQKESHAESVVAVTAGAAVLFLAAFALQRKKKSKKKPE